MIEFRRNDGGRAEAGFKGKAGDCVARAIAIATGRPYMQVYTAVANINAKMPKTRGRRKSMVGSATAAHGIYTRSLLFKRYMRSLGFEWVSTMQIGSGCKVHLRADELPKGRIIVRVTKHYAAVIDGVLHDTHDCSRAGTRCVYGFWRLA